MTNGGEHGLYMPGAAEPHVQVYEEGVLWYKLAQRSGGCGDLIGFRSEQPLIRCPTYHKIITQLCHGATQGIKRAGARIIEVGKGPQ